MKPKIFDNTIIVVNDMKAPSSRSGAVSCEVSLKE